MKQFVVLGGGKFGLSLAKKLVDLGAEVMLVDKNYDIISKSADKVTTAVQADVTDEKALLNLGIRNFDVAIVAIGDNIQSSILVTLMLKEFGIKKILAKAENEMHAKVLYKIGADRVIFPETEMGIRVAKNLMSNGIMDTLELSPEYSILEIKAPKEWVGKSILEINPRKKYGLNIIAIKKDIDIHVNINPNELILSPDILVIAGKNEDLDKII